MSTERRVLRLEIDAAQFKKAAREMGVAIKKVERNTRDMGRSMATMAKAAKANMALLAAYIATKVIQVFIDLGRAVLNTAMKMEDMMNTLNVVTGSAEAASSELDRLLMLVAETPFNLDQLTESYIKLSSAGIEPTNELLRLFGDTASVTTDRIATLNALTDLYSRTVSGGLGLEDLNRVADQGIPVFKILADQLGIARLEVSELGKTAEGARQILEALEQGLAENFGGAAADSADNISSKITTLQAAWSRFVKVFFVDTGGSGVVARGLGWIANSLDRISDLVEVITRVATEMWLKMKITFKKLQITMGEIGTTIVVFFRNSVLQPVATTVDTIINGLRNAFAGLLQDMASGMFEVVNMLQVYDFGPFARMSEGAADAATALTDAANRVIEGNSKMGESVAKGTAEFIKAREALTATQRNELSMLNGDLMSFYENLEAKGIPLTKEAQEEAEKLAETIKGGGKGPKPDDEDDKKTIFAQWSEDIDGMLINSMNSLIDAFIDGEFSFKEFAHSFLVEIAKMTAKSLALLAIQRALGIAPGGEAGASLGFIGKIFGLAKGGAFNNGVQMFASGGVVGAPTAFGMASGVGVMGEAGPEAIMPLQRGSDGNLGVAGPNVTINNYSGQPVTVDRTEEQINIAVGRAVQQSEAKFQQSMSSGQGGYARALEGNYSARRKAV